MAKQSLSTSALATVPRTRDTKFYVLEVLMPNGDRKLVLCFGVERISNEVLYVELKGVKHQFSMEVQKDWD